MIEYTVQVFNDGTKRWYLNGKLHREDGPAIEWTDGYKAWYLNGQPLAEEEHRRRTSEEWSVQWVEEEYMWHILKGEQVMAETGSEYRARIIINGMNSLQED